MENEEREVSGMAVIWKRLMALVVFLLVLSMLESDGIEQEILRIPIGYSAEGGSRLISYGLEEDRFEAQKFIPVIYMYDNEAEMMDALAKEKQLTPFYKFTKPRESIKQPNKHTILSKLMTI